MHILVYEISPCDLQTVNTMVTNRSTSTAGIVLVDVDLLAIGEYYF